jgi:hypothetical protein
MAAFRGDNLIDATHVAGKEFWPIMFAGWKLWPLVSLCDFVLVKTVKMRVLVGNLAGFGWTVYLCLVTPRKVERMGELYKEVVGNRSVKEL